MVLVGVGSVIPGVILSTAMNRSLGLGDCSVVIPDDSLRMTEGLGANQSRKTKRIPLRRVSGREFCLKANRLD